MLQGSREGPALHHGRATVAQETAGTVEAILMTVEAKTILMIVTVVPIAVRRPGVIARQMHKGLTLKVGHVTIP